MNPIACLLLLAASTSVELVDQVFQIPPDYWWHHTIQQRQNLARIDATFEVESGAGRVRIALMTKADFERFGEQEPHGILAVTEPGKSGAIHYRVRHRDDYELVVQNRDKSHPAAVRLRIGLDFAPPSGPGVTTLPRQRQLTVIVLSFLFFFGIVSYSAKKLMTARKS